MKKFIYTLLIAAAALSCTVADPLEGVVIDNTVSVSSNVDIFSRDGGEDMISLTLKSEAREWVLRQVSGEEWCHPSVFSGKASSSIRLVVDPNKDGRPREAMLVFTAKGCENDTLLVNQEGLVAESLPAGCGYGINLDKENNSATLVLYEKDKNGRRHDYCYLIGDFNGWTVSAPYAMKRDEQKGCWWITLEDLDPSEEYMFQYYVGYVDKEIEEPVRVSDPYSRIIYSQSDSKIDPDTYPNLPNYPIETDGLVSAFQIDEEEYQWAHSWTTSPDEPGKFRIEDKNDLVIYELLIRDFTETRDLKGVMEKMDYLDDLGINAIELMPVQEFDNRHSWGYDPNSYFALDKDYGTREMYKKFIDECHKRGIAVLFDVVYNHLTGASTLARLYFQRSYTSAWNPWFNKFAPHPYSVYHDLNHADSFLSEYIKDNLRFLLEEYKIDGFRFDLTKGFTNEECGEHNASDYKPDRVGFLKGYYDAIHEANPYAVMICEHFCSTEEERELGNYGLKVWRKMNDPYCQAAMGYDSGTDFRGVYTESSGMPFGSIVSFMESHDEERMGYKQLAYGHESIKEDKAMRMRRLGLNAAFFLLVPGPKMIWQFGEVGYDFSINQNSEGKFHDTDPGGYRTDNKPIRWDYFDAEENPERVDLYNTYSSLLEFRFSHPTFFDMGAWVRLYADTDEGSTEWPGRYLYVKDNESDRWFALVGNFGVEPADIYVGGPGEGITVSRWYDYSNRSLSYDGNSLFKIYMQPGEFRILTSW